MASDENEKKGVGIGEIVAGSAAGATAAHFTGTHLAKQQIDDISSKIIEGGAEARKAFEASNPKPEPPNLFGMEQRAAEQAREQYLGNAATWVAKQEAAVNKAIEPLEKEGWALTNPLKRPFVAFKNASALGKTGMGVAVAAGTVGTGYLINKWRNSGKESHVEKLERERTQPSPRER